MPISSSLPGVVERTTIVRPRLLDLIRSPVIAPITVITAPAGYGKSTLAAQWARTVEGAVAWVTMGTASNHPGLFLNRLRTVVDDDGNDPVTPGAGTPATVDDVLTALAKRAEGPDPFTVVLDDLHVIENQDVSQAIDVLLQARIPNVRWLLLSRMPPKLPLARLRLEGGVRDIGPQHLSFTRDEIGQVVDLLVAGEVPPTKVDVLADQSEGWIAGIRLVLTVLDRETDIDRSIAAAWGAGGWLDDYVEEEVLGALPEQLRAFVVRTVALPYLDPDLCDAVLGTQDSTSMIEEVRSRLVFVRPAGPGGRLLAYHALFAESVSRLAPRVLPPGEIRAIHLRAAEWLEARGLLEEAAEHAVLAREWEFATSLIRRVCRPLIDSDHSHSAWYWLRKLPEGILLRDPELARWYIATSQYLGHHQAARNACAVAGPMWRASGTPTHRAWDLLSQTFTLAMDGQTDRAVQTAHEAIETAPDDLHVDLMHAWTYIYQIESFRGNDDAADHAFREAERHRSYLPPDQWFWFSNTRLHRVNSEAIRGRLSSAEQMFTHMLEHRPETLAFQDGKLRYRRSAIWLEWNDLERVAGELDDLYRQVHAKPHRVWHPEALLHIGQSRGALGDREGMEAILREAREMFRARGGQHNLNRLEALEVDLWLATDRLPLAQDWTWRKAREAYTPPLLFGDPDPRLARVKTLMASSEPEQALRELEPMIDSATQRRSWSEIVSLAAWRMVGQLRTGDETAALDSLALALRYGRPGGFVRSFMTQDPEIFPFLRSAMTSLPEADAAYVHALIGRGVWGAPSVMEGAGSAAAWLPEPISPREMDVLALLPTGLTNKEIGERLFISERTVKKHVGSILRKLEVDKRQSAVIRAWQLGILTEPTD